MVASVYSLRMKQRASSLAGWQIDVQITPSNDRHHGRGRRRRRALHALSRATTCPALPCPPRSLLLGRLPSRGYQFPGSCGARLHRIGGCAASGAAGGLRVLNRFNWNMKVGKTISSERDGLLRFRPLSSPARDSGPARFHAKRSA